MKELKVSTESRKKVKQGKEVQEEKYYSKEWVRDNITLASVVIETCILFTYDLCEDYDTLEAEVERLREENEELRHELTYACE